ncbi:hypothetical protein [Roseibium sp.]
MFVASLDLDLGPRASFTLGCQEHLFDDIHNLEGEAWLATGF